MRITLYILFLALALTGAAMGARGALAAGPAAFLSTLTDHGGTITQGSPNVFINSKPAAAKGGMVLCTGIDTSGVFGIPHVSGNIETSSSTVLINGLGAARAGDNVSEKGGYTSKIVVGGSPNVFIGD